MTFTTENTVSSGKPGERGKRTAQAVRGRWGLDGGRLAETGKKRRWTAQRSELLQGAPEYSLSRTGRALFYRRAGVAAIAFASAALVLGVETSFFPKTGLTRPLYIFHDDVYLVLKGRLYTNYFPFSLALLLLAAASVSLSVLDYVSGRPLLLHGWLAWMRRAMGLPWLRRWLVRSHAFAVRLGAGDHALDLIACANWRDAMAEAVRPGGSRTAARQLDRMGALRMQLVMNRAADEGQAQECALEAFAIALETSGAAAREGVPSILQQAKEIASRLKFSGRGGVTEHTGGPLFGRLALLVEACAVFEQKRVAHQATEQIGGRRNVFEALAERDSARRRVIDGWRSTLQQGLFLADPFSQSLDLRPCGLDAADPAHAGRVASELSCWLAAEFEAPELAASWLDGMDSLRFSLECLLERLEWEGKLDAALAAQPMLAALERLTRHCPSTFDHARLARMMADSPAPAQREGRSRLIKGGPSPLIRWRFGQAAADAARFAGGQFARD
jgi:hypothetical protein